MALPAGLSFAAGGCSRCLAWSYCSLRALASLTACLAVFASLRGYVYELMAGKRGFHWGSLIASGIDNNRQHFNATSFDVAGLLYIMPYVRDQQEN